MTEVSVAIAAGIFTLAGTTVSGLLSARASQRSVASLQALVTDEKLPAPVRAEAAATLMHTMHRAEGGRGYMMVGTLYASMGVFLLIASWWAPQAVPALKPQAPLLTFMGGVFILAGLFGIITGRFVGDRVDAKKHRERVARARLLLDADDPFAGHKRIEEGTD